MVVYRNWLTKRFMVWGKDPLIVKTEVEHYVVFKKELAKSKIKNAINDSKVQFFLVKIFNPV